MLAATGAPRAARGWREYLLPGLAPPGFVWLHPAADTGHRGALPETAAGNDRVATKALAARSGLGRTNPVTDNQNTSDLFASLMQPWIAQLRVITEGLAGMTRLGESVLSQPLRSLRGLPLPGAVSAAQLDSFARGVAAQRSSIAALQAQLAMFDEQLAALEQMAGPLTEWSKTWAEFERLVMNPRRDGAPEG